MGLFDIIYVVAYLWVKAESKQSLTHAFHIFATYINKNILL